MWCIRPTNPTLVAVDADDFDLNLLRVLDAVLAEQSVTRAARRLHLSQPAVSHSLRKLRVALGDPLIERVGRSMRITAEGRRLAPEVADILRRVQLTIGPPPFDPATTERRFALAMPDPLAMHLAPPLLAAIHAQAPRAQVEVQRLHSVRTPAQLAEGRLDAAISIAGSLEPQLRSSALVTLDWLPVVARSPDDADPAEPLTMTLAELAARPHAIVTRARVNELVDATLAAHGLRRRIGLVVDSDLLMPRLIQHTDLVAVVLAPAADEPGWRRVIVPVTLATSTFHMWWSRSTEEDPAHRWFIDQMVRVAEAVSIGRTAAAAAEPPS
jgi:DNA-binding transcriptional LysR family regulator